MIKIKIMMLKTGCSLLIYSADSLSTMTSFPKAISMLTVHHLNNSRSQRILWLLEELEADYQIKQYARDSVTNLAPPELEAIHPLGKSPMITHGDRTFIESGAIIGAGSVVTKNVKKNELMTGNPAKKIKLVTHKFDLSYFKKN